MVSPLRPSLRLESAKPADAVALPQGDNTPGTPGYRGHGLPEAHGGLLKAGQVIRGDQQPVLEYVVFRHGYFAHAELSDFLLALRTL